MLKTNLPLNKLTSYLAGLMLVHKKIVPKHLVKLVPNLSRYVNIYNFAFLALPFKNLTNGKCGIRTHARYASPNSFQNCPLKPLE